MEFQRAHITKESWKRGTKFKGLCIKDTIQRIKRQPTEWEKALVNHISGKGLTSRTYTELLKLNINENNPIKKPQSTWHFSTEDIGRANKHIEDVESREKGKITVI